MKAQPVVIIDAFGSESDLNAFLGVAHRLYRNDPDYVVEPAGKTWANLHRECFADRQKAFLWRGKDDEIARVVARVSPVLTDAEKLPLGMLGFFEASESPEAVGQLLGEAIGWLHNQGVRMIVGPMDGDTWHRYRFNVGPFDRPPFLMEPYNKPYYGGLWEQAGFTPLEGYYSKVADAAAAAAPLAKIHQRVLDHGYRLRRMEQSEFAREMGIIYRLSTEIFANNFLYEEISWEDFLALYRPARSLIEPELVLIAETAAGEPVGFVFALVDYHRAVVAMRGRDGVLSKLRFLLHRGQANAVNIKSLGVVPAHRRAGVAAALMYATYHTTIRKGIHWANLCLIRDGNPSGRLDGDVGAITRRYTLYQYAGKHDHGR